MRTKDSTVIASARETLRIEAEAIVALHDRLDENVEKAVDVILACQGRVVVTGMGKSGIIARKIASTFASTGTPALFVHPAEGVHGDLGMIVKGDVVLALSNSGETEELSIILPLIKRQGNKLIALTGDSHSTLAKRSDVVLHVGVKQEACPLGLAPTASTTVALAMGDALAVALLKKRGFKAENFALFHPGGILGKKLLLKVSDVMHEGDSIPRVRMSDLMRDAICEISAKKLGVTTVLDDGGRLMGVITDGDLRRFFEKGMEQGKDLLSVKAGDVMTKGSKTIEADALAARAVQVMEQYAITALVVVETGDIPVGIVHLHDLLKAGVV
ncbi:MAG: KpsF/GutQ family sugar-phosphate isomerase [bacterium]|nr:KpsF/GutQ family sugar-phosphate isomerase [bacterium]